MTNHTNDPDEPLRALPAAVLPGLYAGWAAAFLDGPIPAEAEATCRACALLAAPPAPSGPEITRRIHPRTKCCAYYPTLRNFQVGRILNETDPAAAPAREAVAERVRAQFMATPLDLQPPPAYYMLYDRSPYMGSAFRLRCPYYVEDLLSGACGIWQHRNAICMTWFCKHVRGQVSWSFWQTLQDLCVVLDRALAEWCLTQLDLPEENLARVLKAAATPDPSAPFTPEMLDETVDPRAHRALWGPWAGREVEFYRACGQLASALSPREALAIGGPAAALRLRLLRKAYGALMSGDLPRAVRPGRFDLQLLGDGTAQVVTYSLTDPLTLPLEALNLLPYFDGRTVDEALEAMSAEAQLEMEPALVRKLLDFEILVEDE